MDKQQKQCGLYLDATTYRNLLERFGPSLALWRAAEIAILRDVTYKHPLMDVGCGDGLVTAHVLSYADFGVDPNEQALRHAAKLHIYGRLEALPVQQLPLPDGSIAMVLSNSVFEHIPEIDAVLASLARMLSMGERLVFTTPTDTFGRWLFLPVPVYARWRNRALNHLNLWSVQEWKRHLEAVGLEVELVRPYLRREQVWLWDALELLQLVWIGKRRLFSLYWKRLPETWLDMMAQRLSTWDMSSQHDGGGRLIVARKIGCIKEQ